MIREELEHGACQMKLRHDEAQRGLLRQLHCERQRLQEQRGAWEAQLQRREQERRAETLAGVEKAGRERAEACGRLSLESTRLEVEHREEARRLEELASGLRAELAAKEDVHVRNKRLEASLGQCRRHCGRLEAALEASRAKCSEVEAEPRVASAHVEDGADGLKSSEALVEVVTCEKRSVEEELWGVREREEKLLARTAQLEEELNTFQSESEILRQDKEVIAGNCSRLSNAFVQQQAQLRAKEQSIDSLRGELESAQVALKNKVAIHLKQTSELESLRTDRAKLIQDLKEQAMAVDRSEERRVG